MHYKSMPKGACVNFTTKILKEAAKEWVNDKENAQAKYGHISDWDVCEVTDIQALFKDAADFNEDLSRWDVGAVTNMENIIDNASSMPQNFKPKGAS